MACYNRQVDVVKLLLDQGADMEAQDNVSNISVKAELDNVDTSCQIIKCGINTGLHLCNSRSITPSIYEICRHNR
jgi:Ankyrin repeat